MTSEDLRIDLTGGSFSEMAGASRPDSADAEVPQVGLDSALQLDVLEFQPQTPADDLFGNSSPLDVSGQDLQVDSLSEVQGSSNPLRSSADVPISKADYNRALFEARLSAVGDSELKLPWEQGVWKAIFTDDDSDIFPSVVPPVPGEYLVQTPAKSSASGCASDAAETSMARSSISPELKLPFIRMQLRFFQIGMHWMKQRRFGHMHCTSGSRFLKCWDTLDSLVGQFFRNRLKMFPVRSA